MGFWLRKAGTSQPSAPREKEPPNRYEHEAPGDLLHLGTKKVANFSEVGHRANGIRHRWDKGQGYEVLHVCSDDHSRACYMEMLPDEKRKPDYRLWSASCLGCNQTILGNLKGNILGVCRWVSAKHLPRYLAEFQWRFNRRFNLEAILNRLLHAAVLTPPMPHKLLVLAETSR